MPLDKGVPSDSSSRVLTNNMKSLQHSLKFVKECHRSKCVKRLWPRRVPVILGRTSHSSLTSPKVRLSWNATNVLNPPVNRVSYAPSYH